jgi:hypothetical protein
MARYLVVLEAFKITRDNHKAAVVICYHFNIKPNCEAIGPENFISQTISWVAFKSVMRQRQYLESVAQKNDARKQKTRS